MVLDYLMNFLAATFAENSPFSIKKNCIETP
jgi:hypothetical protein